MYVDFIVIVFLTVVIVQVNRGGESVLHCAAVSGLATLTTALLVAGIHTSII